MERLQKIIASAGISSRRKAEELIKNGKVKVNGKVITEMGYKVDDSSEITVNNIKLEKEEKVYFLLNKPRGVITSVSDDKNRKTVIDLIDTNKRIYPVGRLDYDTTGALILTNDGDFANSIMHPKNKVDKVYVAKINSIVGIKDIMQLKKGVMFEGAKLVAHKARVRKFDPQTNTSIVEVIIHDGKNHQVKNMFKAINLEVLKLKRERIAFLDVKSLKSGEYRKLNNKEVKQLYFLSNQK